MGRSLFSVDRQLTTAEWGELKSWRAANPGLPYKHGDPGPYPGRVFWRYNRKAKNGEHWCTEAQFLAWSEKHRARASENYRGLGPEARRERNEKAKPRVRAYDKARHASDPLYAMRKRVRARMHAALRAIGVQKTSKTQQTLGCSFEFFLAHLESHFLPGMTWSNRHLWHIDHTIPLASASTEAEIIQLCHFSNTRPMWAPDNHRKSDKMPHELLA